MNSIYTTICFKPQLVIVAETYSNMEDIVGIHIRPLFTNPSYLGDVLHFIRNYEAVTTAKEKLRPFIFYGCCTTSVEELTFRRIVRAHFSKRGILKVCKAFLSRICHAVVFTQFGYADSKSAPCQALFLVFPFQNCKTKWPPK